MRIARWKSRNGHAIYGINTPENGRVYPFGTFEGAQVAYNRFLQGSDTLDLYQYEITTRLINNGTYTDFETYEEDAR